MKTSEAINIGSKILKNRNIISHKIDAEIILSHVLKTSREKLLINEQAISYTDLKRFKKIISRRLKKEPIAYIFNKKEFRSKDFYVVKNSLIPRPETELLIDPIIKKFRRKSLYFLDVGVGTGCIMLSILNELNNSRGLGIDICNKAISVAKINLKTMNLNKRASLKCRSIDTIYNKNIQKLILGDIKIAEDRIFTIQTAGGTTSLRVASELLKETSKNINIWVSNPTWSNHIPVFESTNIKFRVYPYYDMETNTLLFDRMIACLETVPKGDAVLLHACCHNPTGMDPTLEQWKEIIQVMNHHLKD